MYEDSTSLATVIFGTGGTVKLDRNNVDVERAYSDLGKLLKQANKPAGLEKEELIDVVAESTVERVVRYRNAYFRWYFLLIAGVIAYGAYCYPTFILNMKKKDLQMALEDEVIQSVAVISVLRSLSESTANKLLQVDEAEISVLESKLLSGKH